LFTRPHTPRKPQSKPEREVCVCETSCHLCLPLPSRKKFRSHAPPLISLVLLQFIFVFASFFCLFFLRQGPSGVPVFSPLWRQGQRGSRVPAGGARGSAGRAGGRVDPSPPRAGRLLPPAQERRKGAVQGHGNPPTRVQIGRRCHRATPRRANRASRANRFGRPPTDGSEQTGHAGADAIKSAELDVPSRGNKREEVRTKRIVKSVI